MKSWWLKQFSLFQDKVYEEKTGRVLVYQRDRKKVLNLKNFKKSHANIQNIDEVRLGSRGQNTTGS